MTVGAILQVRMGSTRMPGKALAKVGEEKILEIILKRLTGSRTLDRTVVATSTGPVDDAIESFCIDSNVICFRGDLEDVLGRYVKAAESFDIDQIVRLTGDNPLVDIELMDRLVQLHVKERADYSHCSGFPLGTASEIVRLSALKKINMADLRSNYREHVTLFFHDHLSDFKVRCIKDERTYRGGIKPRLTVDTSDDLALMQEISRLMGPLSSLATSEVEDYLDSHQDIVRINNKVEQVDPWK